MGSAMGHSLILRPALAVVKAHMYQSIRGSRDTILHVVLKFINTGEHS